MNLGIGFVVLMVFLGGAVAALGDNIGRKLGRKRIGLFGLRPKHTAILGTFFSGMVGTGLVIVALSAVSEPVRVWITEGSRVREELSQNQIKLKETQTNLLTAQSAEEDAKKQLQSATEELQARQKDLGDLSTKLKSAQSDADAAKNAAKSADSAAAAAREKERTTRSALARITGEFDSTQVQLKAQKETVEGLKKDQETIEAHNAEISAKNLELTNNNEKLAQQKDNLQAQITQLQAANKSAEEQFKAKLEANDKALRDQQSQLSQARSELEAARTSVREANQLIQQTQMAARLYPVVFLRGDEVARGVIEPGLSGVQIKAKIEDLVAAATRKVRVRNPGDKTVLARLVPHEKEDGTRDSAEQQVDRIVQAALGSPNPTLIVAHAILNSFKTEAVPIQIETFSNTVVYQSGQMIAEGRVDGSLSDEKIAEGVAAVINGPLREHAVKDGIVPAIGTDAPLGEVTQDQILSIVAELKSYGRTARVQFLAAQTIRRGDRLRVTYHLKP